VEKCRNCFKLISGNEDDKEIAWTLCDWCSSYIYYKKEEKDNGINKERKGNPSNSKIK